MYWLIVIFVLIMVFLVWASADIGSGVYVKSVCKLPVNEKVIFLTFDDGPDGDMTPKVLDILGKYGIKSTFFLIGANAEKHPELVRRIVSEGHAIGNHTYSHKGNFPLSSSQFVLNEMESCSKSLTEITGRTPVLFRPPFGVTNPIIGKAVRQMGFQTIGWSIRSLDTREKDSREKVCARILDGLHPGAVILLHDRCKDADFLLEMLIPAIIKKGYRFVPLDTVVGFKLYRN